MIMKTPWQKLFWIVRRPAVQLFKNLYVQYKNPDANISSPIIWKYDDIKAIAIGSEALIGAFSEIVVEVKSPLSNIPGRLIIAEKAIIGSGANIRAGGGEISIGQNSILGQQVSLIASNHIISGEKPYRDLPWDENKVGILIGENVWVGAGVTVLPGCAIGKNSVVGAGSVVTKSIPANEVWTGVPAKKIREIMNLNIFA
jgi:acetyltransferase-like isoleucine patch superfamily enzyme